MAVDWWSVGIAWRARHTGLEHGDLLREAARFEKDAGVSANTIRGCKAAVELVERLRTEGLVDDAGVRALAARPLKAIAVLQRVARYGQAELEPLLRHVLAPPALGHAGSSERAKSERAKLLELEAAVRARAVLAPVSDGGVNAHAFRLRTGSFRRGALAAWATAGGAQGGRTAVTRGPNRIEPFVVDALAVGPVGYDGARLVAETAGTTVRPRLAEALLPALAAARAFHSFLLVTQSRDDADNLAERVGRMGKCGVGVWWYDPASTGGLERVLEAGRSGAPDLAGHYAAILATFFPESTDAAVEGERA